MKEQRTDAMIVEQTNTLARRIHQLTGHVVHPEFLFWAAQRKREQLAWEMAREAQIVLTATDPDDALVNMGWEKFDGPGRVKKVSR